jgi:hypothetical protein
VSRKRPQSGFADRGTKAPRSVLSPERDVRKPRSVPSDPGARTPLWAFRIVDLNGPWSWSAIQGGSLREVLQRLGSYETMTWREIDGPPEATQSTWRA